MRHFRESTWCATSVATELGLRLVGVQRPEDVGTRIATGAGCSAAVTARNGALQSPFARKQTCERLSAERVDNQTAKAGRPQTSMTRPRTTSRGTDGVTRRQGVRASIHPRATAAAGGLGLTARRGAGRIAHGLFAHYSRSRGDTHRGKREDEDPAHHSLAVLCVVAGGRTVPELVLTLQAQRLAGLGPGAHSLSVAA